MGNYSRFDTVAKHYDGNSLFAENLVNYLPGFEYPNWSHKTIGDVFDAVSRNHSAVMLIHSSLNQVVEKHYSEKITDFLVDDYGWQALQGLGVFAVKKEISGLANNFVGMFDERGRYLCLKMDGVEQFDFDCRGRDFRSMAAVFNQKVNEFAVSMGADQNVAVATSKAQGEVEKSFVQAMKIAGQKKEIVFIDPNEDQKLEGILLGVVDHHLVLSLGRSAAIIETAAVQKLDIYLVEGIFAKVNFVGGRAVVEQGQPVKEIAR